MTKVYLAGKWSEKVLLQERMNDLKIIGCTITHDWTTFEADVNNSKQSMADHDVDGVINADMYIGLLEDEKYPYRGTFTELGVALATKKLRPEYKIYIVCPSFFSDKNAYCITNCFFHSSGIEHIKNWDEMLQRLRR